MRTIVHTIVVKVSKTKPVGNSILEISKSHPDIVNVRLSLA